MNSRKNTGMFLGIVIKNGVVTTAELESIRASSSGASYHCLPVVLEFDFDVLNLALDLLVILTVIMPDLPKGVRNNKHHLIDIVGEESFLEFPINLSINNWKNWYGYDTACN